VVTDLFLTMLVYTVPVVKYKTKDMCSADNYRPIASSPNISFFEFCIFRKYEYLYVSDNFRFGCSK